MGDGDSGDSGDSGSMGGAGGLSMGGSGGLSSMGGGQGLRGDTGRATGLGNTGLGSGRASSGGRNDGGLGLRGSSGFASRLGSDAAKSAREAKQSVADSIAAVGAMPKASERSFWSYVKQGVSVAGSVLGIASGTPMGVIGGVAGLADMAKGIDFGGFETGPRADGVSNSFGGNDGGRNDGSTGGGVSFGGIVGGNSGKASNHLFDGTPVAGNKTGAVSAGDAGAIAVPETPTKALPHIQNVGEGVIVTTQKTDYAALIIPALLFFIFKA